MHPHASKGHESGVKVCAWMQVNRKQIENYNRIKK
jgi:hypothetical protein